jgi:hypothetical protein
MRIRELAAALAAAVLLAPAAAADAAVLTFSSQSAFAAAAPGLPTIDFEGIAPDVSFVFIPGTLSLGGATFATNTPVSDGFLFVIGPDLYYVANSVLSFQQSSTGVDSLLITFASPVTAFGALFGQFSTQTLSVTLSTGDSTSVVAAALPDLAFFGLVSDTPFSSLVLTGPAIDVYNLDDVQFGRTPTPVPEPASIALAAFGLAAATLRRRRRW